VVVPGGYERDEAVLASMSCLSDRGVDVVSLELPASGVTRREIAQRLGALPPVTGILSLLAVADDGAGPASTVALLQAMGDAMSTARLWCVTRGAVSTGSADQVFAPDQAPLWGFGRVAARERPDLWGGLVDLPATIGASDVSRLAEAVANPTGEDEIAIRATGVHVRRLVRAAPMSTAASPWRASGTALVHDAATAAAADAARMLVSDGCPRLVLLSRHGDSLPDVRALATELSGRGTEVSVVACDASDRTALDRVVGAIPPEHPLTVVVHAAAGAHDATVEAMSADGMAEALRRDVGAARHLHEATSELPLSAFVLFGTVPAVLGAPGEAGSAAAYAGLEALASHRRASGRHAITVAWNPGADRAALPDSPETAVRAMRGALVEDDASLVIADLDWAELLPPFAVRRCRLFDDVAEARDVLRAAEEDDPAGALRAQLAEASASEQRRMVIDLVRSHASAVLGHRSADDIGPDRPFKDLGFESMTAVQLRNRLAAATGLRLPVSLVFDLPTVTEVAVHLLDELADDLRRPIDTYLDRLDVALSGLDDDATRGHVLARLRGLTARLAGSPVDETATTGQALSDRFRAASNDEIFRYLDGQLSDRES